MHNYTVVVGPPDDPAKIAGLTDLKKCSDAFTRPKPPRTFRGGMDILERTTWALHKSKTKVLKLLVQGPPDEYEMCLVSTEKHPHLKYNQDLAEKFYDFLTGSEGQKIISEFGVSEIKSGNGNHAEHPDEY